jgi:hypothetical protein
VALFCVRDPVDSGSGVVMGVKSPLFAVNRCWGFLPDAPKRDIAAIRPSHSFV